MANPDVVSSTVFQRAIGTYLDAARSDDRTYLVTAHNRPVAVFMSIREYNRLKQCEALTRHELARGGDADGRMANGATDTGPTEPGDLRPG